MQWCLKQEMTALKRQFHPQFRCRSSWHVLILLLSSRSWTDTFHLKFAHASPISSLPLLSVHPCARSWCVDSLSGFRGLAFVSCRLFCLSLKLHSSKLRPFSKVKRLGAISLKREEETEICARQSLTRMAVDVAHQSCSHPYSCSNSYSSKNAFVALWPRSERLWSV